MPRRQHLILFIRAPQLGVGKRRLARDIGDTAAQHFERLMLSRLFRRLAHDPRWQIRVVVTPDQARHRRRLWPCGVPVVGQGAGDLGARMRRALASCPPGPAVLVGSDIPNMRSAHVAAALRLLGDHDLVFGPTVDGGFWLVGARRCPRLPPLFGPVRWSSPFALGDVLANLGERFSVALAARLADVDDGLSYRRYRPTA